MIRIANTNFSPSLVIFDKDGTLIDFDWMWGGWVRELARRLDAAAGLPVADRLFAAMGFDAASGKVLAHGRLAITPMAILYEDTVQVLRNAGLSDAHSRQHVAGAWHIPDPVALAKPLADLRYLFNTLTGEGVAVAVATTDDRDPTRAMLDAMGLAGFIGAMVCADDGIPVKPAGDMVLEICRRLNCSPAQCAVVGDSIADLKMGKAAGAGLNVGVLSGVSDAPTLAPHADVILPSIAHLIAGTPAV